MSRELYDPKCARTEAALKALWLLHIRGKWSLLEIVGFDPEHDRPKFHEFGRRFKIDGRLKTASEARKFGLFVPGVFLAAGELIQQYKAIYGKEYYLNEDLSFDGMD
jgi:hypothetical protein